MAWLTSPFNIERPYNIDRPVVFPTDGQLAYMRKHHADHDAAITEISVWSDWHRPMRETTRMSHPVPADPWNHHGWALHCVAHDLADYTVASDIDEIVRYWEDYPSDRGHGFSGGINSRTGKFAYDWDPPGPDIYLHFAINHMAHYDGKKYGGIVFVAIRPWLQGRDADIERRFPLRDLLGELLGGTRQPTLF